MDDGFAVDRIKICQDPRLKFRLAGDPDMAEHRPCHLGEEPFHKIKPGTVLWREHERKAAFRLGGQPGLGFLRNMRGVIVQDQLDGGIRWIGCVEQLEEGDELPRAMALLDPRMHLASQQVDPGEQAQCAMALVFVVTCEALMFPGLRGERRAMSCAGISPLES
jgi:hypothetical protein